MLRSVHIALFTSCFLAIPAMAFDATTDIVVRTIYASKQVTSSSFDNKVVQLAKDDAASFVASEGQIRGAQIEAALTYLKEQNPELSAVADIELAKAILAQ